MSKKRRKKVKSKQRAKRQQKRRKKKVEKRSDQPSSPSMLSDLLCRPPMAELEAPQGFRPVTATQAMMEFGKPVMETMAGNDFESLNAGMNIVTILWNFSLACERGEDVEALKRGIVNDLAHILGKPKGEVNAFVDIMLSRKTRLLPPEIQPRNAMTMFIRKEETHDIPVFSDTDLVVAEPEYVSTAEDHLLRQKLESIDARVGSLDYSEWEADSFEAQEMALKRFHFWLKQRVRPEDLDHLAAAAETLMRFLHQYNGTSFDCLGMGLIEEFFRDHILRKVCMDDPVVFAKWPIALKLFYDFLADIGYIESSSVFREQINKVQADFIETLKRRYG